MQLHSSPEVYIWFLVHMFCDYPVNSCYKGVSAMGVPRWRCSNLRACTDHHS